MDREIIEAIQKITKTQLADPVTVVGCTVNSVDLSQRSCDCTTIGGDTALDIPNVLLMPEVDDGFLLVPSINSTVFVTYSNRQVPYVVLFSAIDQVVFTCGNAQVIIQDGLIQLGDGSYGGLIQIQQLVVKLNNLETALNNLIQAFNTHIHPGVQTGSGSTPPPANTDSDSLKLTERADLENIVVTHGKQLQ
jgi:hypothetical protein